MNAGLSQVDVSAAAGLSRGRYGRIERGEDGQVSVDELARIGAVLGLELSVRFFPVGDPLRDAGQRAVLERFRRGCHLRLQLRTEVPLPNPGDLRAWDAVVTGFQPSIRCAVEAETRPSDEQALARKLAVKRRDGHVDRLILLLSDTRHNREFLRIAVGLRASFPIGGARAMELLGAGADPGGDAIVLLQGAGRLLDDVHAASETTAAPRHEPVRLGEWFTKRAGRPNPATQPGSIGRPAAA